MVTQTTLQAYNFVIQNLSERRKLIYDAIGELEPCTDAEVSKHLHLPINCVTPRRGELAQMGIIIKNEVRLCKVTGHNAQSWRLK